MGCNLCEVLGSLRPGTGTDGRLSLIGHVGHHPLLNMGREGDALGEYNRGQSGRGGDDDKKGTLSESTGRPRGDEGDRKRTFGESRELEGDRKGTFRCSLEVAWNKEEGGVFVRRFGVERNEKRPRCVLGFEAVFFWYFDSSEG